MVSVAFCQLIVLILPLLKTAHCIKLLPLSRRSDEVHHRSTLDEALRTYQRYGWTVPETAVQVKAKRSLVALGDNAYDSAYYIPLAIGTPPVQLLVYLDTSMAEMVVAGTGYHNSSVLIALFDPPSSSSARIDTPASNFSISTIGAAVSGVVVHDVVSVGSFSAEQPIMVYDTAEWGMYAGGMVSGYLGLQQYTAAGKPSLMRNLMSDPRMASDPEFGFALALQNNPVSASYAQYSYAPGGYMILGGTEPRFHSGDLEYLKCCNPSTWSLAIGDISINNRSLGISPGCTQFDTGSSMVFLPLAQITKLYGAIRGSRASPDGITWTYPCSSDLSYPIVTMTVGARMYNIYAADFQHDIGDGVRCVGVFAVSPAPVVGLAFLKNLYASYRMSTPPAIGIAPLLDVNFMFENTAVPAASSNFYSDSADSVQDLRAAQAPQSSPSTAPKAVATPNPVIASHKAHTVSKIVLPTSASADLPRTLSPTSTSSTTKPTSPSTAVIKATATTTGEFIYDFSSYTSSIAAKSSNTPSPAIPVFNSLTDKMSSALAAASTMAAPASYIPYDPSSGQARQAWPSSLSGLAREGTSTSTDPLLSHPGAAVAAVPAAAAAAVASTPDVIAPFDPFPSYKVPSTASGAGSSVSASGSAAIVGSAFDPFAAMEPEEMMPQLTNPASPLVASTPLSSTPADTPSSSSSMTPSTSSGSTEVAGVAGATGATGAAGSTGSTSSSLGSALSSLAASQAATLRSIQSIGAAIADAISTPGTGPVTGNAGTAELLKLKKRRVRARSTSLRKGDQSREEETHAMVHRTRMHGHR